MLKLPNLLGLLGGVPWTAVALAAVTAWGGYGHLQAHKTRAAFSDYVADVEGAARETERAAREAEEAERALENQRVDAQKEITHANALSRAREAAAARSDGLAAASADLRLRDAIAAAERARADRAAREGAAAVAECETAASTFSHLFQSCTARHRELADDATGALGAARSAGLECEQSYDTLTIRSPQ